MALLDTDISVVYGLGASSTKRDLNRLHIRMDRSGTGPSDVGDGGIGNLVLSVTKEDFPTLLYLAVISEAEFSILKSKQKLMNVDFGSFPGWFCQLISDSIGMDCANIWDRGDGGGRAGDPRYLIQIIGVDFGKNAMADNSIYHRLYSDPFDFEIVQPDKFQRLVRFTITFQPAGESELRRHLTQLVLDHKQDAKSMKEKLNNDSRKSAEHIAFLEKKLSEKRQNIDKLESQLRSQEADYKEKSSKLLESQAGKYRAKMSELQNQKVKLEDRLHRLETDVRTISDKLSHSQLDRTRLEELLHSANLDCDYFSAENKELKNELESLAREHSDVTEEVITVKHELSHSLKELRETKARCNELAAAQKSGDAKLLELRQECHRLTDSLTVKDTECQRLKERKQLYTTVMKEMENRLDKQESTHVSESKDFADLNAKLQVATKNLAKLESLTDSLRQDLLKSQSAVTQKDKQIYDQGLYIAQLTNQLNAQFRLVNQLPTTIPQVGAPFRPNLEGSGRHIFPPVQPYRQHFANVIGPLNDANFVKNSISQPENILGTPISTETLDRQSQLLASSRVNATAPKSTAHTTVQFNDENLISKTSFVKPSGSPHPRANMMENAKPPIHPVGILKKPGALPNANGANVKSTIIGAENVGNKNYGTTTSLKPSNATLNYATKVLGEKNK